MTGHDDGRGEAPTGGVERLNLVGESPAFLSALEQIRRIARCDATVVIEGETGTGKELAARAIHYLGARRDAPFMPVNCGAIPDSLVESELFGHVRGAFTDAREERHGVIAQAQCGTLFLDEVEAMSQRAQVALLRFLQSHEYRPVGGALRRADVRVIAAGNTDIATLASQGTFRRDLLFRLNVLTLALPPLRERGDDVILLTEAFIRLFCRQYKRPLRQLDPEAVARLRAHSWPGNVRELENLVHREILMEDGLFVHASALRAAHAAGTTTAPAHRQWAVRFDDAKASAIARFETAYVTELLSRTRGNISLAARLSGKERSRFGKLVKKLGLERSQFSGASADHA